VEAELLPVDRQTDGHADVTKLLIAFRNFSNALHMIRNNNLPTVLRKNLATAKCAEEGNPIHIQGVPGGL
jgi:hypothetical protein